jgi:hypothetical protein
MPQFVFRCFATACSALAATAFAQQPAPSVARAPAPDAAPSSVYRSAWSGYRPFADEKLISWKDANDEVRLIGGWRTYLRESQGQPSESAGAASTAPTAKDSAKPTPSDAGAAQGHDAHNKPKGSR